jgi:hypothetical protein
VPVLARIDAGAGLARLIAGAAADAVRQVPFGNCILEREGDAFLARDVEPLAAIGALTLKQRFKSCNRTEYCGREKTLLAGDRDRADLRIAARSLNSRAPSAEPRSSVTAFLLAFQNAWAQLTAPSRVGASGGVWRNALPPGGSIRMTSAPRSANSRLA